MGLQKVVRLPYRPIMRRRLDRKPFWLIMLVPLANPCVNSQKISDVHVDGVDFDLAGTYIDTQFLEAIVVLMVAVIH